MAPLAVRPGEELPVEGVVAAAREFLADAKAVEAALVVDRRREPLLAELHDAFLGFRDADESIGRLVKRIQPPLWEALPGGDGNLWGFTNEEERLFPERFAAAAARVPEVDLASVFRSYLVDDARRIEAQRIQLLLAFGEFVAGLDAKAGEWEPRLGVGPAANFLTFAWHCLSNGQDPVFLYTSNRAIKSLAEAGVLGPQIAEAIKARDLQGRFKAFFEVSRTLGDGLEKAPSPMRRGWAVEHALSWVVDRVDRLPSAEDPGASGLWKPRGSGEHKPIIISPGTRSTPRPALVTPADEPKPAAEPEPVLAGSRTDAELAALGGAAPASDPRRPRTTDRLTDDTRAKQRDRLSQLSTKKTVVYGDSQSNVRSGVDLADALPPDRTPPVGMPRPDEPKPEPQASAAAAPPPPPPAPAAPRATIGPPPSAPVAPSSPSTTREPGTSPRPIVRLERNLGPGTGEPAPPTPTRSIPRFKTPKSEPEPAKAEPARVEPARAELARAETMRLTPDRDLEDEGSGSGDLQVDALVAEMRGEVVEVSRGEPRPHLGPAQDDRLARDLHLDPALVSDLQAALHERGRLLLVGPAWSGKTYVARRLAIDLAGHVDRALVLRCHPELSYADVMGGPGQPGLVRALCERAAADRDQRHVLVLDELDRGDAARALGELVGALAERGQTVHLGRSGAPFQAPRNLFVIATARDLPRDPSLVGRLPVVTLGADPAVLKRWLAARRPGLEWVSDLLANLNARLAADGAGTSVGHGVFMDTELDGARVRAIWRREVLPLLAAQGVDPSDLDVDALRGGKR